MTIRPTPPSALVLSKTGPHTYSANLRASRAPTNRTDVVVVGSGFAAGVWAAAYSLRGYRVAILEAGKDPSEKKTVSPRRQLLRDTLEKFVSPFLHAFGMQDIGALKVSVRRRMVTMGWREYGGGSRGWGAVCRKPGREFFEHPLAPRGFNWEKELDPYYKVAARLLGVTTNPIEGEADRVFRSIGESMGGRYEPNPVAAFFDPENPTSGRVFPDPILHGKGVDRNGNPIITRKSYDGRGGCIDPWPSDAKNGPHNTLLPLAHAIHQRIHGEAIPVYLQTQATRLLPPEESESGLTRIETRPSTGLFSRFRKGSTFEAKIVHAAAGWEGNMELLMQNQAPWWKGGFGTLPNISPLLGKHSRMNAEAMQNFTSDSPTVSFDNGMGIGSTIFFQDPTDPARREGISLQPVTSGDARIKHFFPWVASTAQSRLGRTFGAMFNTARSFAPWLKYLLNKDHAKRSVIALCMRAGNGERTVRWGASVWPLFFSWGKIFGLRAFDDSKEIEPVFDPLAHAVLEKVQDEKGGGLCTHSNGTLFAFTRKPTTAHALGGALPGNNAQEGVIDTQSHQVHGYPWLRVSGNTGLWANPGVNPTFTMVAQSLWASARSLQDSTDLNPAMAAKLAEAKKEFGPFLSTSG